MVHSTMLRIPCTLLHRSAAASTLPRTLSARFASSYDDNQWSSSPRSRGDKPPRWGAARGGREWRGGRGWRDDRGERRPPLTRTNDGVDVPQLSGEGVYGIHSVLQALESGHRDAHTLFVREERTPQAGERRPKKKSLEDVKAMERIKELAEARGVKVQETSKWMLNHITGDKPHQGVVLDAAPVKLKEFKPAEPSGWR
jgi:hypothetical protein